MNLLPKSVDSTLAEIICTLKNPRSAYYPGSFLSLTIDQKVHSSVSHQKAGLSKFNMTLRLYHD